MNVSIICPLYKGEKYIQNLHKSIKNQKNVEIKEIRYVLTKTSDDNTEKILKKIDCIYSTITPGEFSHGLTREKEAMKCQGDVIVFITQDVKIVKDDWLEKLVTPIFSGECEATFSRQICEFNNIEKYTRECNYPLFSYINTKEQIAEKGLNTFFFSDASSAIKRDIFVSLNGYDGKDLPTNEDMYIAHKLIVNGYKIKYCADSEVIHSHNFTFKEYYNRYKLTGVFFKQNKYLDKYGTNKSGGSLAKYVLKRSWQDRNFKALATYVPNMAARFIGLKMGKIYGKRIK